VAPTITSTPGTVVTEKIAYSYNPAASESANWACSGMPSGMTVNPITGAIYWSYSIYGDYPLTLYANNSGGSDNQTWNLHVDTESIKATITSSPITTGVVGGRYVYGVSTSLPVTSYYVTGNATGMTVSSNGIVTWVPLHNGTYSVHLLVANTAGYDYQNYTVTVYDAASTNNTVPIDPGAVIPDDQTGALISMCVVGILILGVVRFAFG
jgi:hypothetical protein